MEPDKRVLQNKRVKCVIYFQTNFVPSLPIVQTNPPYICRQNNDSLMRKTELECFIVFNCVYWMAVHQSAIRNWLVKNILTRFNINKTIKI